jgi:hypothetical protein
VPVTLQHAIFGEAPSIVQERLQCRTRPIVPASVDHAKTGKVKPDRQGSKPVDGVLVRFGVLPNLAKEVGMLVRIILKVGGKAVGKPQLFGLDEDEEIPQKLARKVYGEVEITGMEEYVTADWGGIIENSKAYQEAEQLIRAEVKKQLQATHAKEMGLQKARLQRQIDARLQKLPENRRRFAEQAVHRILKRFYGETIERIEIIVDVALDAMDHDAYWEVLERINEARETDVGSFAEALEQFGLLELSTIGIRAAHRRTFLDFLDQLVCKTPQLTKRTRTRHSKIIFGCSVANIP